MTIVRFAHPALVLLTAGALLLPSAMAGQAAPKPPKRERDLIRREELTDADSKFPDLYQAIQRLRPNFLAVNRGISTMGIRPGAPGAPRQVGGSLASNPVIYIDGTRLGDPDVLKGIRTGDVEEVKYMSPNQASSEFGLGHEGGAILVKIYKAPPKP